MITLNTSRARRGSRIAQLAAVAGVMALSAPGLKALVITPTFTTNFVNDFGASAAAAENAWIAAANVYTSDFNNPVNINITVDAVTGTSVFGESNTFLESTSWANLLARLAAQPATAYTTAALGAGGSLFGADPVAATHTWWVTTAEGKALGLTANNLSNDGTTTFGAGNPFTFSGPIAAGTYDFQGVCAHEISEVMGRLGLSGGTVGSSANSYSMVDAYSYTGAGARGLGGGAGNYFSINSGTSLLKLYNNSSGPGGDGLDTRDWAPTSQGGTGAADSFNQYSNSGVVNSVTPVDLEELNVIGYDLVTVPEPSTGALAVAALGTLAFIRRKMRA
jgi:hypothetical protein